MACTCTKDSDTKVLDHQKKIHPDRTFEEDDSDLGLQNTAFSFGQQGGIKPYFEFKTRYTFIRTNGNVSAPKTEILNIYPTYCPFCGVKY